MTKTRSTKRALLMSGLALLMCVSMLIGSTFAWFTDSVTSAGNKIQAGTLKIDLELLDKTSGVWNSIKEDKTALFDYDLWEPGYTEVKILKVENEGSLALKWMAKFVSEEDLGILADVIDVYVCPSATALTYPADRDLTGYEYVGTVRDFVNTIETTTYGSLKAEEEAYLGIALKMQESAGNDYQGKTLGAFDIQIVATQLTYESDSFNNQYDADATLDFAPVSNADELKIALANKEENIVLTNNIETAETYSVDYAANIDGRGYVVSRADEFTGDVFVVKKDAALTLNNIVVDGGAVWVTTASVDDVTNEGIVATGDLIEAEADAKIILNEDAVLQNNDGAFAVNLGTKIGATLTMNGGEISYNRSGAGAVWGGGHITINDGKINNNRSTGPAGAIRMVSNCNLTMNGGEINNNVAVTNGGAIWGYSSSKYYFNGGEMAHNTAGGVGGGIYFGDYSEMYLNGTEIHNNSAASGGGAFRLTNYTVFNMTDGKVYDNTSADSAANNGFYGWNPRVNISGGVLSDNVTIQGGHTPTVGGDGIDGVVTFMVSTVHNTINLTADFGEIKFIAEEDTNFGSFHFQPADGYTYTDGDEAKLICMNEGYETYWDAATGTFRLQAK